MLWIIISVTGILVAALVVAIYRINNPLSRRKKSSNQKTNNNPQPYETETESYIKEIFNDQLRRT